jgi:hypothetical protein
VSITQIEADPDMPLLWALRDLLGLTGTKFGCGEALCGACTVHLDGMAVRSCQTPVSAAAKQKITTIEGLSAHGDHPLQKAWCDLGVPQCGYCQPGPDHERGRAALREAQARPTPRSTPHWPATSAAAGATSASARPCTWPPAVRRREARDDHPPRAARARAQPSRLRGRLGGAVGGLVLGLRSRRPSAEGKPDSPFAPIHFVKIGKDGVVTIVCSRSEMGQGIRSSLPFVLADELGADFARITIVQGDADARYGDQNTDGSHSVRDFYETMRVAGATARSMLASAAAARWGVPASGLIVHDHAVHDPATGKKAGFGELAEAAAALPVPGSQERQAAARTPSS